jgi:23S rRNA (adenine2503-C2)-methyltransferase
MQPSGEFRSLVSFTRDELTQYVRDRKLPDYRAGQIWKWLYSEKADSWSAMTNLPASLRDELSLEMPVLPVEKTDISVEESGTTKIVVRLMDGHLIEEVLIPARDRKTVCVSSQVGCLRHCVFCASGRKGLRRNLSAGEIVGQVLLACREWGGERPSNVVYMGIGEPLDNYDEVLKSIRIINDGDGLAIGARKITVSTCGVVPGIRRLSGEGLQVELSVSLHAAYDELRNRIMPVNREYPLSALIAECRRYVVKTGRMITFEYTLAEGLNASEEDAVKTAALLSGFNCRVNLIPLSPVEGSPWQTVSGKHAEQFRDALEKAGINCTLRLSKGAALRAACGQLSPEFAVD